jgi:hypothetical protein
MQAAKTCGKLHALTQMRGGALNKLKVFDLLRGGRGEVSQRERLLNSEKTLRG